MPYNHTCPCCGHKTTAYSHKLNKGLVEALEELVDFYAKNKRRAKLKELNLAISQHNNFQKLQYFGLVHRNQDGWTPTRRGVDFLWGNIQIPSREITINGEVIPETHEARNELPKPEYVSIKDYFEPEYKQREEYQQEKGYSSPRLFN